MFHLAKIFTPGVSASLLGNKNVRRTPNGHLITLLWLEPLRQRAYDTYCQSIGPHEPLHKWDQRIHDMSPTAFYWGHIVGNFLLTYFSFIRNQRQGNWPGTSESSEMLCPYFFAFGHTNCSRWVPVFLRDMAQLPALHLDVHDNFMKGHFVVQRSEKKSSLMGLDQSQEHSIRMLKEDGGPKGLYNKVEEKMVIELSRAEVLWVIEEFEDGTAHINPETSQEHPESSTSEQQKLITQSSLFSIGTGRRTDHCGSIPGNRNWAHHFGHWWKYGSWSIWQFEADAIDWEGYVWQLRPRSLGEMYHSTFWHYPKASHIHIPLATSVNLLTLGNKTASYKSTAAVVTQMFISLQARPDSNMAEFFIHENAREPPALSDKGKLKTGTKSQILGCLSSMPRYGNDPTPKQAYVVILDMGAVIDMVRPTHAKVLGE